MYLRVISLLIMEIPGSSCGVSGSAMKKKIGRLVAVWRECELNQAEREGFLRLFLLFEPLSS